MSETYLCMVLAVILLNPESVYVILFTQYLLIILSAMLSFISSRVILWINCVAHLIRRIVLFSATENVKCTCSYVLLCKKKWCSYAVGGLCNMLKKNWNKMSKYFCGFEGLMRIIWDCSLVFDYLCWSKHNYQMRLC